MAIIPGGQQIRTTSSDVDLTNRGNSLVQSQNQVYTMICLRESREMISQIKSEYNSI